MFSTRSLGLQKKHLGERSSDSAQMIYILVAWNARGPAGANSVAAVHEEHRDDWSVPVGREFSVNGASRGK